MRLRETDLIQRSLFVFVVLVYKLLLNAFYVQLSSYFDYYGVILDAAEPADRMIVWLTLLMGAFIMPVVVRSIGSALHSFLFLFCVVPASVYVELNQSVQLIFYLGLIAVFIAVPFIHKILMKARGMKFNSLSRSSFFMLLTFSIVILFGSLLASFGVSVSMPSIDGVYEQRAIFHSNAGRIDKYLFDWFVHSLNVLLLILALRYRKLGLLIFSFLLTLYLFSLGGHKGALLTWPFTFSIFLLHKFFKEGFILAFASLLVVTLGVGFLYDTVLGLDFSPFSSILVRRGLLLPSQIYYHYCDFFADHGYNYFSQNFPFKLFMRSPYDEKLPYLIGEAYFSFNEGNYANGNVFADTFANIGYWSYPLLVVVFGAFYTILDKLAIGKDFLVVIPLIFISAQTLLNTGLIVSLISHGLALSILLLFLYPRSSPN